MVNSKIMNDNSLQRTPLYDNLVAAGGLQLGSAAQLREIADKHGEEILERSFDAWNRLLATFRIVFAGVEHDAMRLPPYGGNLFPHEHL